MTDTTISRPRHPARHWWSIAVATGKSWVADRGTSPRCAAAAFFGFLSFFPAIATIALIYGLLADRAIVAQTVEAVQFLVPAVALQLIQEQLTLLSSQTETSLGFGLLVSVPLALWSGSRGVDALLFAMSSVRDQPPRRSFFVSLLYSIVLSIGGGAFVVVALVTVAGLPALLPLPSGEELLVLAARWPVLLVLSIGVLAALYRWGPDRHPRKFRYIWPGAILASLFWLLAGVIFSIYVQNWGHYETTFGSVSAAVVLLLWLYNSAQILVLGAAFNTEIERADNALA